MEAFLRTRAVYKGQLTKLRSRVNNGEANPTLLEALQKLLEKLETNVEDIIRTCGEETLQANIDEHSTLCDSVLELMAKVRDATTPAQAHVTPAGSLPALSSATEVRPPRLDLPKFTGNRADWPMFATLFKEAMGRFTSITSNEQYSFLRNALPDSAQMYIANIPPSVDAFDVAWASLEEEYGNKRATVYSLANDFLNRPKCSTVEQEKMLIQSSKTLQRVLQLMKIKMEDVLLTLFTLSKLSNATKDAWNSSLAKDDSIPPYSDLLTFVGNRIRCMQCDTDSANRPATSSSSFSKPSSFQASSSKPFQRNQKVPPAPAQRFKCPECGLEHPFFRCAVFLKATIDDRWSMVQRLKLCSSCLAPSHNVAQCPSQITCATCHKRHHSALHRANPAPPAKKVLAAARENLEKEVVLATAIVHITNIHGTHVPYRAMLDSGSQVSVISEKLRQDLRLPVTKQRSSVVLADNAKKSVTSVAAVTISSLYFPFSVTTSALVMNKIATNLPTAPIPEEAVSDFRERPLADPTFQRPSPCDLLLGADICAKIFKDTKTVTLDSGLLAQFSELGWIFIGSYSNPVHASVKSVNCCTAVPDLTRFWELEEVPGKKVFLTDEEQRVEEFFQQTTKRENGRYTVRLPLQADPPDLGITKKQAVARFKLLEKKFEKKPDFAHQYVDVIDDYMQQGHLEPVFHPPNARTAYLPHHAVFKDSSTTAVRVVFDASARSSNGKSLNDNMLNGPRLQADIFNHLLRFRTYPVALIADISKMYRRIDVHEDDRDLQRVIWRSNPEEPISDYRLTTVTFGTKSAPYLATKVLQHIAQNTEDTVIAQAVAEDFYVDDLLSGADSVAEAIYKQQGIQSALHAWGFPTHQWASNDPVVMQSIPEELQRTKVTNFQETPDVKTLGIRWNAVDDTFSITTYSPSSKKITRRVVLSDANRLYDPLGWLTPVTIAAKMIIQSMVRRAYESKADWDTPLEADLVQAWREWTDDLPNLQGLSLPRRIASKDFALCGFADASEKGYAAVIYSVTAAGAVSLVAGKSKVSPLKTVSLPRLELLAAQLLAKLISATVQALPTKPREIHAWSDSTIALAWINGSPSRWRTFVANRVSDIQDLLPPSQWHHVPSEENPADVGSRGSSAADLKSHSLWWTGPPWLPTFQEHLNSPVLNIEEVPEVKAVFSITKKTTFTLPDVSSFGKLRRILAHMWRFINNSRTKTGNHFKQADNTIVRCIQQECFPDELATLTAGRPVLTTSALAPLAPFIDDEGVIRIRGRLTHSKLPSNTKHPSVWPHRHTVTDLLVRHVHQQQLHSGVAHTEAALRRTAWIVRARNTVKRVIKSCVSCVRHQAKTAQQMMADLPQPRVVPSPAFSHCGVDYAGPITLKTVLTRGTRTYKGYIALFICLCTRAIHLELVTSLSTTSFLAAFARFTSRRGVPQKMYSDQGTNFVGADNELRDIVSNSATQESLKEMAIEWIFNPPGAPHFGGLWEAGVKSIKGHIKKTVGTAVLTYEEYNTLLCRVEAAVNSRPLLPASQDPDDLEAITPAHFLIQGQLRALPENDLSKERMNLLTRWQMVQRLSQQIWRRWSGEYLTRLQQRPKWWRPAPNLVPGTLVLIQDPNRTSLEWKMGRILDTHPGSDGLVRVATVKTAHGVIQRPIHRLAPLPLDSLDGSAPDPAQ